MSITTNALSTARTMARMIATTGFTTLAISMAVIHIPWAVVYLPEPQQETQPAIKLPPQRTAKQNVEH